MGLSNMIEPEMLTITVSTFLITGAMAYIVFVKNINLGEKLTFRIDGFFQDLLDSMENTIFLKKRRKIGQDRDVCSDEKPVID